MRAALVGDSLCDAATTTQQQQRLRADEHDVRMRLQLCHRTQDITNFGVGPIVRVF